MGRPALEVADIFRAHGAAWRQAQQGHLSFGQLKVMSAIEQCRSAALGGHVLHCAACDHDEIAYNSCLMVSVPLRGVRRPKGFKPGPHTSSAPHLKAWSLASQSAG